MGITYTHMKEGSKKKKKKLVSLLLISHKIGKSIEKDTVLTMTLVLTTSPNALSIIITCHALSAYLRYYVEIEESHD